VKERVANLEVAKTISAAMSVELEDAREKIKGLPEELFVAQMAMALQTSILISSLLAQLKHRFNNK
jgi:hypothetical protein